jgi:hypothetical protein
METGERTAKATCSARRHDRKLNLEYQQDSDNVKVLETQQCRAIQPFLL